MTPGEHHAEIAAAFSARVDGVRDWNSPAPVAGWTARDVVGHLVTWLPGFLAGGGISLAAVDPSVDEDPAAAWRCHTAAVQALLDGPDAGRTFTHPQVGSHPLDVAVDQFYVTDVFLHTWDLARATSQDDQLDPVFAAQVLAGMEPIDDLLRASGQYGPRVLVPDDAPVIDRLIGFIGRDPAWRP